jgi:hypothetical protein
MRCVRAIHWLSLYGNKLLLYLAKIYTPSHTVVELNLVSFLDFVMTFEVK